jgi:uncharacterized protein (TIGR01777 family)
MQLENISGGSRTVLVSGASGFVGKFTCEHLKRNSWSVRRLVRRASSAADEVMWDPERGVLADDALVGVYGVVHLAGESVNGRWTSAKKERIESSRIQGTRLLAQAIANAAQPPRVFVSASAIGYYGERGDHELTEDEPPGHDFLARVCAEWEQESSAVDAVCRRVNPRIGIVLGPDGGALAAMARPIRLGVGGRLGSGQQWVSWISLVDLARLLEFSLASEQVRGAVNAVAPAPVTNAELTSELGRLLNRPTWLTAPKLALHLALGEFATEVLSSKRVLAKGVTQAGFHYRHPTVTDALRWALKVGVND